MKKILIALLLCHGFAAAADPLGPVPEAVMAQLTLADAEQLWEHRNLETQLARDQVAAAAADKLGAAQYPVPQLSMNTSALNVGRSAPPLGSQTAAEADVVLRLDQTIERGGKRDLRMRSADLRFDASRHSLADMHRQGRIALHRAYYDLLLAQEKLTIAQSSAELFEQTVSAARLRVNTGDIAPAELSRIRVDALRAANDVRQAQNDMQQAQSALAYLLGAASGATALHAAGPWPDIQPPGDSPIRIEQRPDVLAATDQFHAVEAARQLAMSMTTRDVTVGLQVERNGGNAPMHSVGFGVSIPLLTGYRYRGDIARAEADLQVARDTLEEIRAQAITEVSKSRSDLIAAQERIARFDEDLLPEATHVLNSAEFAYRQGAHSVMDLLDARRTYKAVQMDAATAHADYAKALAAWRNDIGEQDRP
ncbi:MAG: TolC family protein [Pseudomonadota bacterium]